MASKRSSEDIEVETPAATAGAKKLKLQPLDLQGKVRVVTITSFAALNQVLLCRRVLRLLIS